MTTATLPFTAAKTRDRGQECWVVKRLGRILYWMTGSMLNQELDAERVARKFNSERVLTAHQMAELPHNLDRRGGIAKRVDGSRWAWSRVHECWIKCGSK